MSNSHLTFGTLLVGLRPNLGREKAIYLGITQHRPESKVSRYADIAATDVEDDQCG